MPYPYYVICENGEPFQETDGSITLYGELDDRELGDRFMAIVYLSEDSSVFTIRKFDLIPHYFVSSMNREEFIKKAQATKRLG